MKPNTVVTLILSAALGMLAFSQDNDTPLKRQQRPARFQQFFTIRGVEFTKEQQVKIDDIYQKFLPRLTDNQSRWDGIITEGQQRVRREAQRKAQDADKQGLELLRAVGAAVEWSTEQLKRRTEVKKQRDQLVAEIRTQLTALLTDEQRSKLQQTERARKSESESDFADARGREVRAAWTTHHGRVAGKVGPTNPGPGFHPRRWISWRQQERQWRSAATVPRFRHFSRGNHLSVFVSGHSSCVVPRQRQSRAVHSSPWPMNGTLTRLDSPRQAVQRGPAFLCGWVFMTTLLTPTTKIRSCGTQLDNMHDGVGRTVFLRPSVYSKTVPGIRDVQARGTGTAVRCRSEQAGRVAGGKYRLFEEVSPIHHLTKDDVPAMLSYGGTFDQEVTNVNIGIHHARFGKVLKEWMDALGIRCDVYAGKEVLGGGPRVSTIDFLRQQFEMTD